MLVSEYKKLVNDLRKQNKNNWVSFTETVEGVTVGIKFYKTWLQLSHVTDGITEYKNIGLTPCDCSVKSFNAGLDSIITKILELKK